MANPTATRAQLKVYFAKNCIPTDSNFSDLIDGMLNQTDDGIFKSAGNPLCIAAAGDATTSQKAINLYASVNDVNNAAPAWMIQLNPRGNPNDPTTARAGFAISDANGNSCLFIDKFSENLGIGTVMPAAKLDINGGANVGGALSVAGATTLNTTLSVTGAATLNNTLSVTGAATLANTLSVAGAATLSGLTANGAATFNNAVSLSGTAGLSVAGMVTVGKQISVQGNSVYLGLDPNHAQDVRIIGFQIDSGDGADAGKIAYKPSWSGGALALTGAGAAGSRKIMLYDAVEVAGNLTVDGSQTTVKGALSAGGAMTCSNSLQVNGAATFTSGLSVASGAATFTSGLTVTSGAVTFNSGLTVASGSTSVKSLAVSGNLMVGGQTIWPKVAVYSDQQWPNAGKYQPGNWTVDISPHGFASIQIAYVMLQGFTVFSDGFTNGQTSADHNETEDDIIETCWVRITAKSSTSISGTCYCSQASGSSESDNQVMFTLVVIGN